MKYLRKNLFLLAAVCLCLIAGLFTGCGNTQTGGADAAAESGKQDMSASADASEAESTAPENASEAESTAPGEFSEESTAPAEKKSDIIILYTNDVHCAVDDNIGYAGLVSYRKELEAEGYETILVDAGDAIQGGTFGTLTKGESVVRMMNEAGYDVSAVGNHEFDYGMERLFELRDEAEYPYVCCNLVDVRTGELPFAPYQIIEAGAHFVHVIDKCDAVYCFSCSIS